MVSDADPASMVGAIIDRVEFTVEQGKVREFAHASGARDAVHVDPAEARRRNQRAVLATATHVVVAGHYRDQRGFVAALGLDLACVVVGSTSWEYARPLRAGDHLIGTRRVVADDLRQGSRGGTMRLVTLETTYVDSDGDMAVRQREVIIERGRKP